MIRGLRTATILPSLALLSRRRTAPLEPFDDRARMLLDMPVGVLLLLDDRGRVLYTNSAIERFLGYAPRETVGRPLADLFEPASQASLGRLLAAQFPGDPVASGEFRGRRKDGSLTPLQVVVQSAVVESMTGEKVMGVYLRDFSERGRLVDELASRGAALARSNRELEQFAYIASHDLQEPLRMVGSYTQLLEQRYGPQLDDDAREFLRYAREGATRMRELIDALLSYSRIDTRAQPFRPVALDHVLDLALQNLRESIAQAHATVHRTPLPELDGDALQLGQVLQNLVGNALKFRRGAPVEVWISAQRDGPDWRISVRDNGIGIPPEYQQRIFILFQRLHTREEYPGTGIGLSVCKKVVERHGGRIWVESTGRPGEGTTFAFTLPAERAPAPEVVHPEPTPGERQVRVEAMSLIEERLKELV